MLEKLISGGQTGVDRAALDAALKHKFKCGGFCPSGRKAEDGVIDTKYPLQEHASKHYAVRTLENVLISDGTLIIYHHKLIGGSALTLKFCKENNKYYLLVDSEKHDYVESSRNLVGFIKQNDIKTLNVAGPRKSQWQDGYRYTYSCINHLLEGFEMFESMS